MSKPANGNCTIICWALSALAGLLVLWWAAGAMGLLAALLLGGILAFLLGLATTRIFCAGAGAAEMPTAATPPASAAAPSVPPDAVPPAPVPPAAMPPAGKPDAKAKAPADPAPAARPIEAPAAATAEPARPVALDAPRGGQADDLKRIKGIGPKLEALCHDLGIWHFDQIAAWGPDEVAWMDDNLQGFRGRVSRDEWVAQAKALAAGKERT